MKVICGTIFGDNFLRQFFGTISGTILGTRLDKFEIISNRIIYCIMLCNKNIINKTDYLYHFISALSKFEETSDSEKFKKPKIFLKGHQHW